MSGAKASIRGCRPQGGKELGVAGLSRQRQIEVVADAGALAALAGMSPEERIEARRIGVHRNREDIGSRVEDALRAVAVMEIDVEDGDPRLCPQQALRSDRRIVEEAEAAGDIHKGMVARRPAQRIGGRLARLHASAAATALQALQQALSKVSAEIGQAVSAIW